MKHQLKPTRTIVHVSCEAELKWLKPLQWCQRWTKIKCDTNVFISNNLTIFMDSLCFCVHGQEILRKDI